MSRRLVAMLVLAAAFAAAPLTCQAQQPAPTQAYGQNWGTGYSNQNWERFYHYPYTYYPHNYWGQEYFKSSNNMYYRYPKEMQIPVYNKKWHNYYPSARPYHSGHHFILDVF